MTYVKQQLTIGTATFTPFVVSMNCSSIVIRNTSGVVINLRTDPNDATTQDTLNPGDQEVVPSVVCWVRIGSSQSYFISAGTTVGWFQSTSGTVNILATLCDA